MAAGSAPLGMATRCCVAGGGPAGLMLGLLLARAGIEVVVLEKHADFLRDFRGDTIHPSTLEVMHELGLLDGLLTLPHQKVARLNAQIGERRVQIADFSRLGARCRFIAMMPQWDFLNYLATQAARHAGFRLMMATEATGLVEEGGRIVGVRARRGADALEIRADLVVAADGRHSAVRDAAGLSVDALGAPMDVLWFRLSRRADDPDETMGRFDPGRILVMINRADYWQCAYVIPKGAAERLKAGPIAGFRGSVAAAAPFLGDRVDELAAWDDVKLLTVRVDRLKRWHRPGLLCIGDAAHAMSPVGGVGINLAIQDAVATANLLVAPLRGRRLDDADLARVQRRRAWPTRMTQRLQIAMQDRIIAPVLGASRPLAVPRALRLMQCLPILRAIPARIVGIGFRPEHVGAALRA